MNPSLGNPPEEQLSASATRLVSTARRVGAEAVAFFGKQSSAPDASEVKRWTFFATAAALTVGIGALMKLVSEAQFARIYETFLPSIQEWSKQGEDVLLDCHRFVAGQNIPGMPRERSLGMWVLANSFQRPLEVSEAELAYGYGAHIVAAMNDWWQLGDVPGAERT